MTEAEQRSALPWRCQIVRIEEGGELDRALLAYLERWKRRSGRKIPTAVAIRGLLRIALLHTGCIGKAANEPMKRGRKPKAQQLELRLCDPFAPVRELGELLGIVSSK